MSEECNHLVYQRVVMFKERKKTNKSCMTCEVAKMQEEAGRQHKGEGFNLFEFRLARNQLEMEKILISSGNCPIPAAYVEYREELRSRGTSIVRVDRESDLSNYDHSRSVGSNPIQSPYMTSHVH